MKAKDDEVLANVHATSINASDWHWRTVDNFLVRLAAGMFKPNSTILGGELPAIWWRGGQASPKTADQPSFDREIRRPGARRGGGFRIWRKC